MSTTLLCQQYTYHKHSLHQKCLNVCQAVHRQLVGLHKLIEVIKAGNEFHCRRTTYPDFHTSFQGLVLVLLDFIARSLYHPSIMFLPAAAIPIVIFVCVSARVCLYVCPPSVHAQKYVLAKVTVKYQ